MQNPGIVRQQNNFLTQFESGRQSSENDIGNLFTHNSNDNQQLRVIGMNAQEDDSAELIQTSNLSMHDNATQIYHSNEYQPEKGLREKEDHFKIENIKPRPLKASVAPMSSPDQLLCQNLQFNNQSSSRENTLWENSMRENSIRETSMRENSMRESSFRGNSIKEPTNSYHTRKSSGFNSSMKVDEVSIVNQQAPMAYHQPQHQQMQHQPPQAVFNPGLQRAHPVPGFSQ